MSRPQREGKLQMMSGSFMKSWEIAEKILVGKTKDDEENEGRQVNRARKGRRRTEGLNAAEGRGAGFSL